MKKLTVKESGKRSFNFKLLLLKLFFSVYNSNFKKKTNTINSYIIHSLPKMLVKFHFILTQICSRPKNHLVVTCFKDKGFRYMHWSRVFLKLLCKPAINSSLFFFFFLLTGRISFILLKYYYYYQSFRLILIL